MAGRNGVSELNTWDICGEPTDAHTNSDLMSPEGVNPEMSSGIRQYVHWPIETHDWPIEVFT